MHTLWSDGSGSILEMARSAQARGYEYIAITDHSKGLKIAGGIDEQQLQQQSDEIESVNALLRSEGGRFVVLGSVELNLNPLGEGDMDQQSLKRLDLVLGCFHSSLRKKEDQTERYLASRFLATPKDASTTFAKVLWLIGRKSLTLLQNSTKLLRSMAIQIDKT